MTDSNGQSPKDSIFPSSSSQTSSSSSFQWSSTSGNLSTPTFSTLTSLPGSLPNTGLSISSLPISNFGSQPLTYNISEGAFINYIKDDLAALGAVAQLNKDPNKPPSVTYLFKSNTKQLLDTQGNVVPLPLPPTANVNLILASPTTLNQDAARDAIKSVFGGAFTGSSLSNPGGLTGPVAPPGGILAVPPTAPVAPTPNVSPDTFKNRTDDTVQSLNRILSQIAEFLKNNNDKDTYSELLFTTRDTNAERDSTTDVNVHVQVSAGKADTLKPPTPADLNAKYIASAMKAVANIIQKVSAKYPFFFNKAINADALQKIKNIDKGSATALTDIQEILKKVNLSAPYSSTQPTGLKIGPKPQPKPTDLADAIAASITNASTSASDNGITDTVKSPDAIENIKKQINDDLSLLDILDQINKQNVGFVPNFGPFSN